MDSIEARLRERGRITGERRSLVSLGHATRKQISSREHAEAFRRRRERADIDFVKRWAGRPRGDLIEQRLAEIFHAHPEWAENGVKAGLLECEATP